MRRSILYKRVLATGAYQSFTMGQPLQLIVGLLACLAAASALPGLFPRNNITTYRYYADVKTGNIEPTPYASQFVITGLMRIKPELSDPNLKNAYYIVLEVTHGVRNGEIQHFEKIVGSTLPIPDAAKVLNDPFMVVFDDNGKVKSLMVNKHEAGWSRNMKKSIASMLQLDLGSMTLATPMKPHAFLTKENTIYGDCSVAYDVHRTLGLEENHFTVTKIMEPMACSNFVQHVFNSKETKRCLVESEEEMTTASRRVFQIENMGEDLLIKSLVAHGVINYFPWKARSEAHYILANQSMEFQSLMTMNNIPLPKLNIEEMVKMDDVTFQKSETLYAPNAGVDPTFGRYTVNLELSRTKIMKMLAGAADYMNENHLVMTSPEMKHGQTINRLLQALTQLDVPSLEFIFNNLLEGTTPKELTMTNLLLNMIPYVGTNATCLFTRNIIRKKKIADPMSITMLTKLPYNIRMPSDALLVEMEDLMRFAGDISPEVRNAGILSFATMIYKTHGRDAYRRKTLDKNVYDRTMNMDLVQRYVQDYYDHMMNEPTYEMKMVYMQALRNIEIGGVHKLLEPIIRGELKVSEKPEHLRLHAMMVNAGMIRDVEYIHNLYWPILANTSAPLELRICAYSILINQPPQMDRLMSLYWLMVYEKNEHLYNYHYTSMKTLANTVDPCMKPMMEMARKILRFTKMRPVSGIMTGNWMVDYENKEFGFGESAQLMMAADELTGIPFLGMIELVSLNNRRPSNQLSWYVRVEGLDHVMRNIDLKATMEEQHILMDEIKRVLTRASEDMPPQKPIHIEFSIMTQGRTVMTKHLSQFLRYSEMTSMMAMVANMKMNWQTILFDELYTMQVPNDIGLPSMMYNNIPRVMSIQTNNEAHFETTSMLNMKFESITKNWRHGYYSMEVYNPIIDTWHAIRRVSTFDVSLPLAMNIGYNQATKTVKLLLPILPLTQYSMSGMRSYSLNYVMVMGAEKGLLQQYCEACNPAEIVTKGIQHRKNITLMNYDSKDMGLHLGIQRFDCERVLPPKSRLESSTQMLDKDNKNTWGSAMILGLMTLHENYHLRMIDPEMGTCGYLFRLKPSMVYPTSQIDINLRVNVYMLTSKPMSLFPASKVSLRGMLETVRVAGTKIPRQTWSVDAQIDCNEGQTDNQLQVQLTRTSPGQKDLKICIDGYKLFPTTDVDLLDHALTIDQEIIGNLSITMGETDMGICVDDGMSVILSMKGEMSDEQKAELKLGKIHQMCQLDMDNPLFLYAESSIVPRTPACLREALLHTTLRKYSYTMMYKNISENAMPIFHSVAEGLRGSSVHDLKYLPTHTEPGMMKMLIEYPLNDEGMNLIFRLPTHEERYTGMEAENSYGWYPLLDNTRFSRNFIINMQEKEIKFCTIYPEIMINADGAVLPFNVPSEYTLLTGDYKNHMFSVFVKRLEPKKLGLLMSITNRTIEVIPSVTVPTVTVDGEVMNYDNGFILHDGLTHPLRIIWTHDRLVMRSVHKEFDLEWTGRSVTLMMNRGMQGQVTGLCGHLDDTHAELMSTVYTFEK